MPPLAVPEAAQALYRLVSPLHDRSQSVDRYHTMPQASPRSELALLGAVLAGDPNAAKRFLEAISATLWTVVVKLEGEGPNAEAALLHVVSGLKEEGNARLKAFAHPGSRPTYR